MPELELLLTKYDGSRHRWLTANLLGTDEFGTWLGTPAGTVVNYAYGPRSSRRTATDAVRLIPHGTWWMALFLSHPDPTEIYCDVITPAVRSPAGFTVIDLDLDVIRHRPDGRVKVDDEPEFAENALRYAYPTDVVSAAAETAAELQKALIESRPPFNGHHTTWLRQSTETS